MLSKTRSPAHRSAAARPDDINGSVVDGPVSDPSQEPVPNTARAREAAAARTGTRGEYRTETRSEHLRRKAHRTRLYGYAIATVALVAYLIALAASNTAGVHIDWVFGSSHVSLVWLVLFAAILGWVLGIVASARFHWRTRAPRAPRGGR